MTTTLLNIVVFLAQVPPFGVYWESSAEAILFSRGHSNLILITLPPLVVSSYHLVPGSIKLWKPFVLNVHVCADLPDPPLVPFHGGKMEHKGVQSQGSLLSQAQLSPRQPAYWSPLNMLLQDLQQLAQESAYLISFPGNYSAYLSKTADQISR